MPRKRPAGNLACIEGGEPRQGPNRLFTEIIAAEKNGQHLTAQQCCHGIISAR
jgi:hypothetical protein